MKIAVDVMGADHPADELVIGVLQAINESPTLEACIVGDEAQITPALKKLDHDASRVSVQHASQFIAMHESPWQAVKDKKDSSVLRAAQLVKKGEAQAMFSPGNTGAALTAALVTGGRLEGIKRPALATFFPTHDGGATLILDVGANPDAKDFYYVQNAIMGEVLCQQLLKKSSPRIGLLCNGTEREKGNEITHRAFELLSRLPINFIGNVEGKDIFNGRCDVVVTDGMTGNIVLKSCESAAMSILKMLKDDIDSSVFFKTGALLLKPAFDRVKRKVDPSEFGGAPLLGVRINCLIGHGSSRAKDIKSGALAAERYVGHKINEKIAENLKRYGAAKMQYFWEDTLLPSVPVKEV